MKNGSEEEEAPDYPVTVFFTREGYFKKRSLPQGLRTAGAHKLKEGDEIVQQIETRNNVEALFFTDRQQVYKVRLAELEDGKVAQMGIFIPGRLGMDEGENILDMVITSDYSGFMLFFFCQRQVRKDPAQLLRHQAEPPQAAEGLLRQGAAGEDALSCPRTRSWPSAPARAGCCWSARRRSPQRPPATVRAWRWSP